MWRRCLFKPMLALLAGAFVAAPAQAVVFRVSIGAPHGRPIAPDYLGVALEYRSIPALVGGAGSLNPVLVQLLRNLTPRGRPVVRIGGQSADRTWWPVRGVHRPLGVTYSLTPSWIAATRGLASALRARLILGLGLEANQPTIDRVEAGKLLAGIGRSHIAALEIGNEPELYTAVPWYRRRNGRPLPWYAHEGAPVFARPPGYGPGAFDGDFLRTIGALGRFPGVPIAGPETGLIPWLDSFQRHFVSRSSRIRFVTWHAYGLNQCVLDPSSPHYPTIANLLAASASRGIADGIAPYVALAHRAGASFRIDEMGSVTCNGRRGVSDTFASALWALDALFTIAADGVDGVNLHTFQDSENGLFDFARANGRWEGIVHPLYYGALMFAHAAPAGARLLALHSAAQHQVRAWATLAPNRLTRVLLINDSLTSPAVALVSAPGSAGPGTVERLRSPRPSATGGVTLGGESFGARTATGTLPPPKPVVVRPRAGQYAVQMPPASAALLTLRPHGRDR